MSRNCYRPGHRWTVHGDMEIKVITLIPVVLYVTRVKLRNPEQSRGTKMYNLHITPWFTLGINMRADNDLEMEHDSK